MFNFDRGKSREILPVVSNVTLVRYTVSISAVIERRIGRQTMTELNPGYVYQVICHWGDGKWDRGSITSSDV